MSYEIGIGVGLAIIPFIFAYLSMNMFNENRFIRLFFLIMSMWGITMTLSVLEELANMNSLVDIETMLETMTTVMISISTLFTMLMFVMAVISAINLYRGKHPDEPFDDYDDYDDKKRGIFNV